MSCYYCDAQFVDKDIAVELPLVTMERQGDGDVAATDRRTVYAHVHCVKGGTDG